jgi:exopolyphosphatase/pppGpp-phosphohydrolase
MEVRKFLCFLLLLSHCMISSSQTQDVLRDTKRICAVDMGSNTFKFIVAEIRNGEYIQHTDIRKTAGVGDDLRASELTLKRKVISDAKLQEIQSLLAEFQNQCKQQTGSDILHAIATAAFREAENIDFVRKKLQERGVQVKVLTAEEESAYAYEAATLGKSGFAVLDLGSRTTEFVNKRINEFEWVLLNTGYKVAWDDFYESAPAFHKAASRHTSSLRGIIRDQDWKILQNQKELVVIEVGETASYLLGLSQDQIEGKVISRSHLQQKLKELQQMDEKTFADLKRNFKDAARVLPRAVFLEFVLDKTGYDGFRCTNRELNAAVILRLASR